MTPETPTVSIETDDTVCLAVFTTFEAAQRFAGKAGISASVAAIDTKSQFVEFLRKIQRAYPGLVLDPGLEGDDCEVHQTTLVLAQLESDYLPPS